MITNFLKVFFPILKHRVIHFFLNQNISQMTEWSGFWESSYMSWGWFYT